MIYLDSCALIKLIRTEDESAALQRWLDGHAGVYHTTSELARVEVLRVIRRKNHTAQGTVIDREAFLQELAEASEILDDLELMLVDGDILDQAGALEAPALKTLDAVHLASAERLGSAVTQFITYDQSLRKTAAEAGMPVVTPS